MSWSLDPSVDPLADGPPPRHAVESDDEDDLNALASDSGSNTESGDVSVIIKGVNLPQNLPLIIVSNMAGAYWSRGAKFVGEQLAGVFVDTVQVGLVLPLGRLHGSKDVPPALVLSSEALARLPYSGMHPFAKKVIEDLKPSRVTLLDTYPTLTYLHIDPTTAPGLEPPIRYITTDVKNPLLHSLKLFKPPNLISSTTAAFLTQLSLTSIPSTLLLLPSKRLPTRPPKSVEHSSLDRLTDLVRQGAEENWSEHDIQGVTDLMLKLSKVQPSDVKGGTEWKTPSVKYVSSEAHLMSARGPRDVGEGAMYV
ncbi:hypothetical protein DL96DRAFT_1601504 [Flagelloscypha sp. PMI_526]|nr:hypothetical protein DL96DRAFT_1601504 [Flagelloscypha sp. PMI_526]